VRVFGLLRTDCVEGPEEMVLIDAGDNGRGDLFPAALLAS